MILYTNLSPPVVFHALLSISIKLHRNRDIIFQPHLQCLRGSQLIFAEWIYSSGFWTKNAYILISSPPCVVPTSPQISLLKISGFEASHLVQLSHLAGGETSPLSALAFILKGSFHILGAFKQMPRHALFLPQLTFNFIIFESHL